MSVRATLQPTGPTSEGRSNQGDEEPHASPAFYWAVGAVLTVITAVEVAIFYVPSAAPVLVPSLLLLSAAKFLLVVLFFMHLKFDSRVFTGLFSAGMVLAIFLVVALVILYKVLPHPPSEV